LPAHKSHPCFQPPSNPEAPIWQYLDFTKYVSFLEYEGLFFSRADRLGDPYEGVSHPEGSSPQPGSAKETANPRAAFLEQKERLVKWMTQWTYVNSWHICEHESAAFWKLYGHTAETVALRSTYTRLQNCLPENAQAGVVQYIDYKREWQPEGNAFWPFVHKRKSFQHERELRALVQDLPFNGGELEIGKQNQESGKTVPVNLRKLVERVYVSPAAPPWFVQLVGNVTERYGFAFAVQQSGLVKDPVY